MKPMTRIAGLLTGGLACAFGGAALAADDEWQQTMVAYVMGAALEGDAYVGPLVGADLTYQLLTNVRWQANDRFGVAFGYRLIAFDYEDGKKDSARYQRYDLVEQGPLVGVTIDF